MYMIMHINCLNTAFDKNLSSGTPKQKHKDAGLMTIAGEQAPKNVQLG